MQIKNLSKELDTETMTAVRGGDNGNSSVSNMLQEMGIDTPVAVGYGYGDDWREAGPQPGLEQEQKGEDHKYQ